MDNAQMLPSPFDNVHGGASAVTHIPSSMQQSSTDGDQAAGIVIFLRVHLAAAEQLQHLRNACRLLRANIWGQKGRCVHYVFVSQFCSFSALKHMRDMA